MVKERKELEEPLAYQELIFPVAIAQSVRSLRKTSETSWYLRMKNLRSAREWRLLWLQHHWLRLHHWRILSFNPLSMKLLRPEHPELGEMLFDVICPRNLLKTKVILGLTYLVVLPLCYLEVSIWDTQPSRLKVFIAAVGLQERCRCYWRRRCDQRCLGGLEFRLSTESGCTCTAYAGACTACTV